MPRNSLPSFPLNGPSIRDYYRAIDKDVRDLFARHCRGGRDADEFTDEGTFRVFLLLHTVAEKGTITFATHADLWAYTCVTARYVRLSMRRQYARLYARFPLIEDDTCLPDTSDSPERLLELRMEVDRIDARRGKLSHAKRRLIDGLAQGDSYEEIALWSGRTINSLRVSTHRLRRELGA